MGAGQGPPAGLSALLPLLLQEPESHGEWAVWLFPCDQEGARSETAHQLLRLTCREAAREPSTARLKRSFWASRAAAAAASSALTWATRSLSAASSCSRLSRRCLRSSSASLQTLGIKSIKNRNCGGSHAAGLIPRNARCT